MTRLLLAGPEVCSFRPFRELGADEPRSIFRRYGGLNGNALSIARVIECQSPSMEHEASRSGFLFLWVGVNGVADKRVPQV